MLIKAKGEYYYRELERLEKIHQQNLNGELIYRKMRIKEVDSELIERVRCMFSKGKVSSMQKLLPLLFFIFPNMSSSTNFEHKLIAISTFI